MESNDWNVAKDLDKLREMTQSPGGTPSRWVRQMAAEIIRLSKERDDWRELQHSAAQCLANRIQESEARGREIDRLGAALQAIAAYNPGTFRPLEDEIAIWRLATEALAACSGVPQSEPTK